MMKFSRIDKIYSGQEMCIRDRVSAPIKAMCLNVAHDCNLRCSYCFASTGDLGGERKLMTAETGKKAIDYLLKYSGDRHNLEMDFFGGEPLMAFDVVKEVVDYARSKEKEYNCLLYTSPVHHADQRCTQCLYQE